MWHLAQYAWSWHLAQLNVQFAIQKHNGEDVVYVLEVNPRASRTVPYLSKATGVPLAKVASRVML